MTPIITSYYLTAVLDPRGLREAVARVVGVLSPLADTFEAIAFRGVSGALVAPSVAASLEKPLIVVRKPETSHGRSTEGALAAKAYVIVDDLVASGDTVRAIVRALPGQTCVGVVCYMEAFSSCVDHPRLPIIDAAPPGRGYTVSENGR